MGPFCEFSQNFLVAMLTGHTYSDQENADLGITHAARNQISVWSCTAFAFTISINVLNLFNNLGTK